MRSASENEFNISSQFSRSSSQSNGEVVVLGMKMHCRKADVCKEGSDNFKKLGTAGNYCFLSKF